MDTEKVSTLVSVVIPTFNRAEQVCSAIASVSVQTYEHLEIIVVDDGSTDETRTRVEALADPRIRYLRREFNRGVSISRNEGVQASRGVFVAFLDSDDRWEPTKIGLQVSRIKQYPDPEQVVCYSQVNACDGRITSISPRRRRAPDEGLGDYLLSWDGAICPSTLMLSRRLALRVPFDPGYRTMEDWDLFLRLDSLGVDWCYIEQPLTLFDWNRNRPRLSGSATPSEHLAWLEDHRALLTDQAIRRFTMGPLIRSIAHTGQRRWYGLTTLGSALKAGVISRQEAYHHLVRILFLKSLGGLRR